MNNTEIMNEELDVIEVLNKKALFSNDRIDSKDIPENLYVYDLRENEDGDFISIENHVVVNHGGTIVTKESIDMPETGYIPLKDDTSPNFLGEHMTIKEFVKQKD